VLDAVKRIEKSKDQLDKAAGKTGKRLGRGNKDSGIDAMEAKSALAEITGARIEAQKTFIDGVFEMRRHMRADEWRTAFDKES
jgi:hypothetical protein